MKDYSAETGAALADEDQTIKAFAHAVVTPATRTPSPGTTLTERAPTPAQPASPRLGTCQGV